MSMDGFKVEEAVSDSVFPFFKPREAFLYGVNLDEFLFFFA